MSTIKNISGDDRFAPGLGGRLILAGQEVEVPVDDVTAYTQQEGTWAPADAEAREAHKEMLEVIAWLEAVANPPAEPTEEQVRALLGEMIANEAATDLIKNLKTASLAEAQIVLELERDATRTRSTVVAAAEKRIEELDPQPVEVPDDGVAGTGPSVNAETGEVTAAGDPLSTIEQTDGEPLEPADQDDPDAAPASGDNGTMTEA